MEVKEISELVDTEVEMQVSDLERDYNDLRNLTAHEKRVRCEKALDDCLKLRRGLTEKRQHGQEIHKTYEKIIKFENNYGKVLRSLPMDVY